MPELPPPVVEHDRTAVITIQGGGIYGLNMLGQLSALLDSGITPLAYAGTSAGAVVATLAWAGYTPKQIRDLFVDLSVESRGSRAVDPSRPTLLDLLGPFGDSRSRYNYERFRRLAEGIKSRLGWIGRIVEGSETSSAAMCLAKSLIRRLDIVVSGALGLVAATLGFLAWRVVISWWLPVVVFVAAFLWLFRRVIALFRDVCWFASEIFRHPLPHRGFFTGDRLREFLDEKLKASPYFSAYRNEIGVKEFTFGDIERLRAAHRGDANLKRLVPLILTATSLETRRLVLIASFRNEFAEVPIAQAVRASAGFPIFFRPAKINCLTTVGWHVDGGVIANHPAWVFSRSLRASVFELNLYPDLATRPWLNVGLRVVADPAAPPADGPNGFLRSIFDLATGHARNALEEALSSPLPRTFAIEQPATREQTNAPSNLLAVDELTNDKIRAMFARGEEFARPEFARLSFALNAADADAIQGALGRLVRQINLVLGHDDNESLQLRSNVFLPSRDTLILRYATNMDGDSDMGLELPTRAGLTGTCFSRKRPYVCNLDILRCWAKVAIVEFPESTQLGMTPAEHLRIRGDRTWLMSIPIFDPIDSWFLDNPPERSRPEVGTLPIFAELSTDRDGAVFGVLNVDGAIPHTRFGIPEDPEASLTDPRIASMIALMWACSAEVARILSRAFAARSSP